MKYYLSLGLFLVTCLFFPLHATAKEDKAKTEIQKVLRKAIPDLEVDQVSQSPVSGIYQVMAGSEVFFVTADKKHMFYGTLLDLTQNQNDWNITENLRREARLKIISELKTSEMVTFTPTNKKGSVIVFTDVDCGYCRRFHQHMDEILAEGIEVKYLAFPRTGVGSASYKTMASIWCAKDQNSMMTQAKAGKDVPEKSCDNPVAEQFELGQQLGIRGTPTLIFENGVMLPSYVTADKLATLVAENKLEVSVPQADAKEATVTKKHTNETKQNMDNNTEKPKEG